MTAQPPTDDTGPVVLGEDSTVPVIHPYCLTEASNAVIDAAAAQAFRTDDLRGHVPGRWDWDTIPDHGRREYRALVVAVLLAAIAETERQRPNDKHRREVGE